MVPGQGGLTGHRKRRWGSPTRQGNRNRTVGGRVHRPLRTPEFGATLATQQAQKEHGSHAEIACLCPQLNHP